MCYKLSLQIAFCLIVTTLLALTSHIYISEWVKPALESMTQGLHERSYSPFIIVAAYGTAFITVGLIVFLYYHTQHLLPIKSNLLKAWVVACILLELKGNLIRQPIMDILVNYSFGMQGLQPFIFVGLNMLDKWVSAYLSAIGLVYLCPKKY
jgi:hypothetical protein